MLAQYAAGAGEKSRSDNEVAPIVERKHQAETELRNANKLASKLAVSHYRSPRLAETELMRCSRAGDA